MHFDHFSQHWFLKPIFLCFNNITHQESISIRDILRTYYSGCTKLPSIATLKHKRKSRNVNVALNFVSPLFSWNFIYLSDEQPYSTWQLGSNYRICIGECGLSQCYCCIRRTNQQTQRDWNKITCDLLKNLNATLLYSYWSHQIFFASNLITFSIHQPNTFKIPNQSTSERHWTHPKWFAIMCNFVFSTVSSRARSGKQFFIKLYHFYVSSVRGFLTFQRFVIFWFRDHILIWFCDSKKKNKNIFKHK